MSTAKGKNNKKNQAPAYVTTGKNAAVTMTFGIVFLALGVCFLLSMAAAGEGYITKQLSHSLNGLCGPVCALFPVLLCWCGITMLVATRHRVNARGCVIAMVLYLLVLAGYTLTARYSPAYSYLEFIEQQSQNPSFGMFLRRAYLDGAKGAGGLMGMLLAYPLWKMMGTVLSMIFIIFIFVALVFVLLRKNPGEVIRKLTETSEQRQAQRYQRRQEKENQKAARELEKEMAAQQAQEQQPIVQQLPMENVVNPQQVLRTEETYEYYTEPAPDIYQRPVRQTVKEVEGFYPVSNQDLYDEHFPIRTQTAYQQQMLAAEEEKQPTLHRSTKKAALEKQKTHAFVNPYTANLGNETALQQDMTAMEKAPESIPVVAQSERKRRQENNAQMPMTETKEEVRPAVERSHVAQAPLFETDEPEADDLPWDDFTPAAPKKEKQQPLESYAPREEAPPQREEKKASWSDMVQKKQRELKMPEHTTAKGEPKPVYTDPVMPITGERIAIKPAPVPKADAKLDGTRASQMKQTEMVMPIRYQAPPIRLLKESSVVSSADSAMEDQQRAEVIEGTLGSFGVDAEVKQIMHGPSITRFAIQIAPGVKVSKVTNTADNLALDLKTKHVRVEAPIQGTSFIGIEVPNKLVSTVSLKEVLDSEKMHNATSPLMVALGMDIAGTPVLCDLSKMPHLLIAGATGSGKSVCINSIVCSLLYRSSPEQVRLIMIDPKQVELNVYNDIPHLLVPVISDPRKAAGALAWVVQEMQERYGKFSAEGVRNLAGYNDMFRGTEKELPNIVVIIDEMADLMEVCRKDVEESIRRLAALARAAGIYMVLATQRPSVDVITGVVKNNIPSRIAFAVSSGTDSRTIIDIYGAEKLMGKGDMLYKPAGSSPVRVQGCFVSDEEVNAITDYISRRYSASYDPNIMEHLENADKETPTADTIGGEERAHGAAESGDGTDELLMEAIEMAVEDEQISTSLLQRRFRIGYARAGRLVDEMEKRGIVSASEGAKPRRCLITREQYYQMFEEE